MYNKAILRRGTNLVLYDRGVKGEKKEKRKGKEEKNKRKGKEIKYSPGDTQLLDAKSGTPQTRFHRRYLLRLSGIYKS